MATTTRRERRDAARTRRAINRALRSAQTPAMREELVAIAQRQAFGTRI